MGLVGVGALTSCGNGQPAPEAIDIQPTPVPEPDPNLLDELNLIGAYLGVIEAFPELRGSLSAIADQHRAHATELGATDEQLTQVTAILPAAVAPRPAIGELIARERAAAELRVETALTSNEPTTVRALTFIAASESSHIPELRDLRSGA